MPRVTPAKSGRAAGPRDVLDRPGRWKLLLRRQRRFLRPGALTIAVVGLVVFVSVVVRATAPAATLTTMRDRFGRLTAFAGLRVEHVDIEGRATTPEALLRAAIGVRRGDPILGFSVAAARSRVESIVSVDTATVERRLPDTILVSLTERRPFAVWQNQGRFVLIDRAGGVLADQSAATAGQLPLVVGAGAPAEAAALLDKLATMPAVQSHVVAAVRVGERRWNLRMDNGADVMLPSEGQTAALDQLAALQKDHGALDRPLAVIDLRLPDRIVLRDQPGATPAAAAPPTATTKRPT